MLLNQLLGVSLLVVPWRPVAAFWPVAPLSLLQRSDRYHSKHERRPGTAVVNNPSPQPQLGPVPQPGRSGRYTCAWALPAAGKKRAHGRRSNTAGAAEDTLCGALTRSDLMQVVLAVAAGTALGPLRALAAAENAPEKLVGASAESTVALGTQDSVGGMVEEAGAKYMVGADEVRAISCYTRILRVHMILPGCVGVCMYDSPAPTPSWSSPFRPPGSGIATSLSKHYRFRNAQQL